MDPARGMKTVADSSSNLAINEKLHEWEKLENCSAPLSTFQRNICLDLGDEVTTRPFSKYLLPESADSVDRSGDSNDLKIRTTRQFLDWYTGLSTEWLDHDNDKYESCLLKVIEKRDKCDEILKKVDESIFHLEELKSVYNEVSSKTNPLHSVSEKLSSDEALLNSALENINMKLSPFQVIESVIKRLESSAIAVTSNAFIDLLDDIDNCHAYFKAHESYKESASYLLKTRHCLSRALMDVKSYITSVLDATKIGPSSAATLPSPGSDSVTDAKKGSKFMAHYGRFQSMAARLKPLLLQLETRADKSYEYECALEECQKYYVHLRQQTIVPPLRDSITQLISSRVGDYCSLLRSAATQLIYMSQDEDKLYYKFFSKPCKTFSEFLESTCSILYDTMRPLIIHIKHMETLAEFCSILRVEIVQDHVQNNKSLEAFGNVAEQLLRDVQERLVFRANVYFKTDILQFNPSPGDLAYPEKLEMMKNIADEIRAQESVGLTRYDSRLSLTSINSGGDSIRSGSRVSKSHPSSSPADLHGMWYPTIRRTLVCLSRLYRCVEKPVFQGLAQEAIVCCCQNVEEATQMISKNKSLLDGYLFQIKHILILREQIAPFQVDFTITEMSLDFNQLKSAAYGLLQKEKLFTFGSNNAILEFILHGSPLLRENYLDSRKIVDKQLKTTCESFISSATSNVVAPMSNVMQQIQNFRKLNKDGNLKEQPFGQPENVRNIVVESVKKVKSFIPSLLHKMELYLANPDTQFILYKPIKTNIISTFTKMQNIISENFEKDDQLLIGCPSPEQITVLLSSTILSKKNSIDVSNRGH
ncbi:hypothetical protein V9T40_003160 [Parthenolecanium corni]|uniref:Conserved oligomeric Golgi complex subunit 3 n=1 Tax=Parthenolecanium corni TaxID=536013 RepID=A0AAN9TS14_9HEMI